MPVMPILRAGLLGRDTSSNADWSSPLARGQADSAKKVAFAAIERLNRYRDNYFTRPGSMRFGFSDTDGNARAAGASKTGRVRHRRLGMSRMECREGASSYASSQCLFARGCVFRVGEVGDLACQTGSRRVEKARFPERIRSVLKVNKYS